MPYASITGLQLKSPFLAPAFWWHAVRSMRQAYAASGLIRAQARKIGGVHHTLTVWESEAAMRAYLVTGAHLGAMKAFHRLATGRTIGATECSLDHSSRCRLWLRRQVPSELAQNTLISPPLHLALPIWQQSS